MSLEKTYLKVFRSRRVLLAWLGDLTETLADQAQEIREVGIETANRAAQYGRSDGVGSDRDEALAEAAKAHGIAVGMLTVVVHVREGLTKLGLDCPNDSDSRDVLTLDELATIRNALPKEVRNSGPRSRQSTKTGAL